MMVGERKRAIEVKKVSDGGREREREQWKVKQSMQ